MIQIKPLSEIIKWVDVRNRGIVSENLLGINIDKCFMASVANIIGTDLSNYKLISKNQFACNPMHVGRDEKMPVAIYCDDVPSIVSPAYFVFEVKNSDLINPDYLMLWFRRAEFDRECWFHTDGSVRGGITWEEIIDMTVPVPPIGEQNAIVEQYKDIERRIELKRQINDNLESQAQAIFDNLYDQKEDSWLTFQLGKLCKIKGGKRLPLDHELVEYQTKHPYIRVRDLTDTYILTLNDDFVYITDDTHKYIKSYIVQSNDIIISIVGTIGLISIIDSTLDGANLTENCVRLTNIEKVSSSYIFFLFNHLKASREIEERTVGAVQAKLPIYNIETINVPIPNKKLLDIFNSQTTTLLSVMRVNISEIITLEKAKESILAHLSSR